MAGKRISGITGEIILKVDKWSAGIKQAQKDSKALENSLKPTKELALSAGKAFTAAGLAIGGSLVAMAKAAANYGDAIGEASAKTGITTQQLSKLKYAAEQNDASFDALNTGLKILSRNMLEAATGGKEQERMFKALGIATKDSQGNMRDMNSVLLDVADIFETLPDGTTKSALAMELFGRSGADLIPVLNTGRKGIEEWGNEAERLGVVIDETTAAIGDEFNRSLDRAGTAMQGLAISVGNVLLPAMTDLANSGAAAVKWAADMAREYPIATKAAALLATALTGAGGLLLGLTGIVTIAPKVVMALRTIQIAAVAAHAKLLLIPLAIAAAVNAHNKLSEVNEKGLRKHAANIDATDALNRKLIEQGAIGKAAAAEMERLGQSTSNVGGAASSVEADMRKMLATMGESGDATKKTTDEWANLKAQFTASLKPADDLEKTIARLQREFGNAAVLKVYGDQIIAATATQKEHGFEVSNNIKLLNAMAIGAAAVRRNLELVRAAIPERLGVELIRADIPETIGDTGNVMAELGRKSLDASAQIKRTEERVMQLSRAGATAGDIMQDLGSEIEDAKRLSRQYGVSLGETTRRVIELTDAASRQQRRVDELAFAWSNAIQNMARNVSRSIADMIVDWDFKAKSLVDIAKNTAKDMLGAFIEGFISPFTDRLAGLAGNLGAKLGDLVFGGGGAGGAMNTTQSTGAGGGGGILGGVLGNVLGGIFGPGGGAGGTVPQPTGTGTGGGGLLGFLTGPLGGGIVSGITAGVQALAGRKAHDAADDVVKLQESFEKNALAIVDSPNLTGDEKSRMFEALTASYLSGVQQFSAGSENNSIAAIQSQATTMDFITQRRLDLAPYMTSPSGAATGGVTVNAPLTLTINVDGEITAMEVRDIVAPELTNLLETGLRGIRERWTQLLSSQTTGTVAPVGI